MGRRVLTRKIAWLMWALLMFRPLADAEKILVWKRSTAEIQLNGKVGENVTLATGKATLDDYTKIVWLIIGNGQILSYAIKDKTASKPSAFQTLFGDPSSNNEQGAIIHQNQGERQSLTQGDEAQEEESSNESQSNQSEGQGKQDEATEEKKEVESDDKSATEEKVETKVNADTNNAKSANADDAKQPTIVSQGNQAVESNDESSKDNTDVAKEDDASQTDAKSTETVTQTDTWQLTEGALYKKEKIHFNPKNGDLTIGPLSLTDEAKYKVTMTPKSGKAEEKTFALKVTASAGRRCSHPLPLMVICSMSLMWLL